MDVVTLSRDDYRRVLTVAGTRQAEATRQRLPERHGAHLHRALWNHVLGAGGECAVARYLGIPWEGTVNTFQTGADVGDWIQVRTRGRKDYELKVHRNDKDYQPYVLANLLSRNPMKFLIRGWMMGFEAKQPDWYCDPTDTGREKAYFPPHAALHPIRDLNIIVHG